MERHPVTNAQFAEFVAATGYVTVAERPIDPGLYPGVDDLRAGAMVFRSTPGPVDLHDWRQWWEWVPGANWRHPFGPDSDVAERADHPVVQVAYPDAVGLRALGSAAPAERGRMGVCGACRQHDDLRLGDEAKPDGRLMANTWQGSFPYRNDGALGWVGNLAGGDLPAQWVRSGRHDRQRVGVDRDRVLGAPPARPATESLLHPVPTRGSERQSDLEGRLAFVCVGVLPSLPTGRAVAAVAGHRDDSHWISLRVVVPRCCGHFFVGGPRLHRMHVPEYWYASRPSRSRRR